MLFCAGCADYGISFRSDEKYTGSEKIAPESIVHRIYLIGDGGNAPMNGSTPLLKELTSQLSTEKIPSSCVWLGDNIYPVGLAPENHPDYALGKHRLLVQAETGLGFNGRIYFIPGNHDWYEYGLDGLNRQEELLEGFLELNKIHKKQLKESYFLPNNGCPGPEVIEIEKNVLLVIIDSQWYLSESRKQNKSQCSISSLSEMNNKLLDIFESNKDKSIILVCHHPLYTFGKHGGYYSLKENLFPFSQLSPGLIIPLPISGFLFNNLRAKISPQDTRNKYYLNYTDNIMETITGHGNVIVASGHEHNLQLILKNKIPLIISGSGSKTTKVEMGEDGIFTAGSHGYAVVDILKDHSKIIRFFILEENHIKEVFNYRVLPTE